MTAGMTTDAVGIGPGIDGTGQGIDTIATIAIGIGTVGGCSFSVPGMFDVSYVVP